VFEGLTKTCCPTGGKLAELHAPFSRKTSPLGPFLDAHRVSGAGSHAAVGTIPVCS
jgi:hypothetical protein